MKLISIAYTLVTAGSLVAASPHHRHHHDHVLKRQPNNVEVVTLNEYVVNGKSVSLQEACAGIASGDWKLSDGSTNLTDCETLDQGKQGEAAKDKDLVPEIKSSSAIPEAPVEPASTATPEAVTSTVIPAEPSSTSSSPAPLPSKGTKAPAVKELDAPASKETEAPAPSSWQPQGNGLEREFPSNTIDCSTFPKDYGPIPIHWMQIGGWSGIQYITETDGVITGVRTAVAGDKCVSGAMCSYACPPGWQKSQWPTVPPAEGRSVGGLFCNSQNKLELANPNFSKTLCIQGTGATRVENKLSLNAMICRTDYPGEHNWLPAM